MRKKLSEKDLQERTIGSARKHCDEKHDRINETKRKKKQYLKENCYKSKTFKYKSNVDGKSKRKAFLAKPIVIT